MRVLRTIREEIFNSMCLLMERVSFRLTGAKLMQLKGLTLHVLYAQTLLRIV